LRLSKKRPLENVLILMANLIINIINLYCQIPGLSGDKAEDQRCPI